MENFTRFENQYIMMLAIRAKLDLEDDLRKEVAYTLIDPNIPDYIKSLEAIAFKAKANCQEYDKKVVKE